MVRNQFPLSAGTYMCQRDTDLIIIVVKGLFPTLQLDGGFDLGYFLKKRKLREASKEILANIELFPEMWTFTPMRGMNYSVFAKNEFHTTGKLELPMDRRPISRNSTTCSLSKEYLVPRLFELLYKNLRFRWIPSVI